MDCTNAVAPTTPCGTSLCVKAHQTFWVKHLNAVGAKTSCCILLHYHFIVYHCVRMPILLTRYAIWLIRCLGHLYGLLQLHFPWILHRVFSCEEHTNSKLHGGVASLDALHSSSFHTHVTSLPTSDTLFVFVLMPHSLVGSEMA